MIRKSLSDEQWARIEGFSLARLAIAVGRAWIVGSLSTRFCGWRAASALGVICRQNSVIGRVCIRASGGGRAAQPAALPHNAWSMGRLPTGYPAD